MVNTTRSFTRPGVEGAVRLVELVDSDLDHARQVWRDVESKYPEMIAEKGGKKLKLLEEFCQDLGDGLREKLANPASDDFHISQEQLLKIVEWKFAKGKPRYALMKHLNANTETTIQDCSSRAFNIVSDKEKDSDLIIKKSIDTLCELKGVGPATASAILCLLRPDLFSFMDDEVIESLYANKRGYTFAIYRQVNQRCTELANVLLDDYWNPWRVGRALWTASKLYAANDEHFLTLLTIDNDQDDQTSTNTKKTSKSIKNKKKTTTITQEKNEQNINPRRKRRKR